MLRKRLTKVISRFLQSGDFLDIKQFGYSGFAGLTFTTDLPSA